MQTFKSFPTCHEISLGPLLLLFPICRHLYAWLWCSINRLCSAVPLFAFAALSIQNKLLLLLPLHNSYIS